jgi:hypothetical protein
MLGVVNSERERGMAESWGKIVDVRLQERQFKMRPLANLVPALVASELGLVARTGLATGDFRNK